jgi:hypothetical protein
MPTLEPKPRDIHVTAANKLTTVAECVNASKKAGKQRKVALANRATEIKAIDKIASDHQFKVDNLLPDKFKDFKVVGKTLTKITD